MTKEKMGFKEGQVNENKTHISSLSLSLKNRKFNSTVFPVLTLIFMFTFILFFQNCGKSKNERIHVSSLPGSTLVTGTSTTSASTTTDTTSAMGDKAVFRLSEKYGGENISNVSWQTYRELCRSKREIAFKTGSSIQIPWNSSSTISSIPGSSLNMRVLIPLEQCLIYRHFHLSEVIFSVDSTVRGPINRKPWSVAVASLFSFDNFIIARANATTCMPSSGDISFSLSDDTSVKRNYFPVGSSVSLEFNPSEGSDISLEDESFQWSIKKIGDDTELADQSHTSSELTHTFSQIGLYSVSVQSSGTGRLRDDKELLIGLCEEEVDAVEIVLGEESFGESTPEIISQKEIIFNYVRPADTDANNKVTLVFDDSSEDYQNQHVTYKYKRSSTSKFIDIDIQNADECFLDDESISSCSGKALDISTLDTDTTQCTDAVFVVAASKTGQEEKVQKTFYKHCPADQDYCYFGEDLPDDHHCPS